MVFKLLIAGCLLILLVMLGLYFGLYIRARQRLVSRLEVVSSAAVYVPLERRAGLGEKIIQRVLDFTRDLINTRFFSPHIRETLKVRLKQAGFFSKQAPDIFIVIFSLCSVGLGVVIWSLMQANTRVENWVDNHVLLTGFLFVWFNLFLPNKVLNKMIVAYKQAMLRELPDFLELFLICAEAGDGHDQALERVMAVLKYTHRAASQQMAILLDELALLPHRKLAWAHLANRVDLTDITDAIRIIEQCEVLGTPLGNDLRTQIKTLRQMQLMAVEEKIMRLPVIMTLPLVLCIFPALMMVVLGPAFLSLSAMNWI